MPIGGKSVANVVNDANSPSKEGEVITLEVLLRVIERSGEGPIKQANGTKSIFLIEMPIELIQETLPPLKAKWINAGDSKLLQKQLFNSCNRVWNVQYLKGSGIQFIVVK